MILVYIPIFVISSFLLFWAGSKLVDDLMKIAKLLNWREFVVAFFAMAFAGSLPNVVIGINSIVHQIPQLSLAEIVGGNVIDLTLVIALAVLVAKSSIPAESKMVQTSAIFTTFIAILPLILLFDGKLTRGDGLVLLSIFVFYIFWLFSKEERFKKIYKNNNTHIIKETKTFFKTLGSLIFAIIVLLVAAEGVVRSAAFFSFFFNLPLTLVGILVVGLGNALPETYFAIISAKKGETWMILGNLMGNVIVPATLVLGIVSLISPFEIINFSPFLVARIFLVISALFFLLIVRSGRIITKKEAVFLFFLYFLFIFFQILVK